MRLSHFETFQPLCPQCLTLGKEIPLKIRHISKQEEDCIVEATLICTNKACANQYPVIDAVPILLHPLANYLNDNFYAITQRHDLAIDSESILGDAAGPGAIFNIQRHYLSTYAWDHYGDFIGGQHKQLAVENQDQGGSIVECLQQGMQLLSQQLSLQQSPQVTQQQLSNDKPVLDMGCATGRTSFELAQRTNTITLGIDLNFSLLRFAQRILRNGTLQFPLKKLGVVYDRIECSIEMEAAAMVDFWVCDAVTPPFSSEKFSLISAFNVLDAVTTPKRLLSSISRHLHGSGHALLTTPYDWSAPTPLQNWLGGHAQYAEHGGISENILRELLNGSDNAIKLRLLAEQEHFPWRVRLHNRRTDHYDVHIMVCGSK